ncbi:uncharacterized protein LOC123206596 [Mangifera indica]|uniref:uncharacterized protein LOC123206596 n=1 Tax=Mangifera indica TaxID=29780 RepID=UPI001CF98CBC|nr:uncharacterized protein LOC123206596 [Mangifera indica]
MSPFKPVYDREPAPLGLWADDQSNVQDVNALMQPRNFILDELKSNLHGAQEVMKQTADKKCRYVEFQLKKQFGSDSESQQIPEDLQEDLELVVQPEDVLDYRYSSQSELELLVKWRGLPSCDNTWESYDNMVHLFPTLLLSMGRAMLGPEFT